MQLDDQIQKKANTREGSAGDVDKEDPDHRNFAENGRMDVRTWIEHAMGSKTIKNPV